VRALSDRVVDFSTLAVRNRIHAEVLRLARQAGVENNCAEIRKMPTHEEIAARVSTHREAVVRELKTFKECGLVEKPGHRRLIVLDVARLERIVEKGLAVDE
jgi:CRP/FNR family cyclic AMP-dependent transcriptional regulator